jgi:hypothetical protein
MNEEPPSTVSIHRKYNREKYIYRHQIQNANRWLHDKKKQLLTVESPPATGKTWFLERLREEFDVNGIIQTLWITVPENRAFQTLLRQLQSQCPDIGNLQIPSGDDISEPIEKLARDICQNHFSGKQVVLFIDNGDVLSDAEWQQFERTVIEPFTREPLLRLVIAIRKEQKIRSAPLSWYRQRLLLGNLATDGESNQNQGEAQIQKLAKEFPHVAHHVNRLLEAVPAYDKTHAGLNTFLFLYAEKYPDAELTVPFFRILLESLNPISDDDVNDLVGVLSDIADYTDEWVIEELATWQKVSNSEAWERAQKLIDNHLVINIAYNRYKVADGVREFARAALRLQTAVTIETTNRNAPEKAVALVKKLTDIETTPSENAVTITPAATADKINISVELPTQFVNQLLILYGQKQLVIPNFDISQIEPQPTNPRHWIEEHFNEAELRLLCFDLGIDLKAVVSPGATWPIIVIEVIAYGRRHGRMPELLTVLRQARPDVPWPF